MFVQLSCNIDIYIYTYLRFTFHHIFDGFFPLSFCLFCSRTLGPNSTFSEMQAGGIRRNFTVGVLRLGRGGSEARPFTERLLPRGR